MELTDLGLIEFLVTVIIGMVAWVIKQMGMIYKTINHLDVRHGERLTHLESKAHRHGRKGEIEHCS